MRRNSERRQVPPAPVCLRSSPPPSDSNNPARWAIDRGSLSNFLKTLQGIHRRLGIFLEMGRHKIAFKIPGAAEQVAFSWTAQSVQSPISLRRGRTDGWAVRPLSLRPRPSVRRDQQPCQQGDRLRRLHLRCSSSVSQSVSQSCNRGIGSEESFGAGSQFAQRRRRRRIYASRFTRQSVEQISSKQSMLMFSIWETARHSAR